MVQRKIKEIIIVVVFSVIPAILLYFSSSVHFFDYLKAHGVIGESLNIATIKEWCLVISIFLAKRFGAIGAATLQQASPT